MTTAADKLAEALRGILDVAGAGGVAEWNALEAGSAALAAHDKLKPNPANMVRKVCDTCGSEDVHADATTSWDVGLQQWIVDDLVSDEGDYCANCEECRKIIDKPLHD